MTITPEVLTQRLTEAEEKRDNALKAADHWEGHASELRALLSLLNKPAEPSKPNTSPSIPSGG